MDNLLMTIDRLQDDLRTLKTAVGRYEAAGIRFVDGAGAFALGRTGRGPGRPPGRPAQAAPKNARRRRRRRSAPAAVARRGRGRPGRPPGKKAVPEKSLLAFLEAPRTKADVRQHFKLSASGVQARLGRLKNRIKTSGLKGREKLWVRA